MPTSGEPTGPDGHTPKGFVIVVDEVYAPAPGFNARHFSTYEAAVEFFENTPVFQLWIRTDLADIEGASSFVDYLVGEGPWEGKSQIEEIVIFYVDTPEGRLAVLELHDLLAKHYKVSQNIVSLRPENFIKIGE